MLKIKDIRAFFWNLTISKKYRKYRNLLMNIFLLIITLLILLFIIEGTLRVTNNCEIALKKSGNLFTFLQKVENPSLVYELKPNSEGYLAGKYVKINSYGMRSKEISTDKDVYRIAFIGDSITFGWGVELNESYPEVLGEYIEKDQHIKVEILNFGVPGYVSLQEYTVLKNKVINYSPDLIIIGNFLSSPDNIWNLYQTSIPISPSIKIFFKERSCTYNFLQSKLNIFLNKAGKIDKSPYINLYNKSSEEWKNYKDVLGKISAISKDNNIPVVTLILPNWYNLNESYEFKEIHNLLNMTLSENNLHPIDTYPELSGINAGDYSIEHVHPNAEGHKLLAQILYKKLKNNYFI